MLVIYAVPVEIVIKDWLNANLQKILKSRKIECPTILGHPLFFEGVNQSGVSSNLPKIGIENTRDTDIKVIGDGYRAFRNNQRFKDALKKFKSIPQHLRTIPDVDIEPYFHAEEIESWQQLVKSEIIITGWASGGSGRNVCRFLRETVDASLLPMRHDIQEAFPAAKITIPDTPYEANITSNQFAEPVFGFEIPIEVQQIRKIFRIKPKEPFSDKVKFDIYFTQSKTQIDAFEGFLGFDTVKYERK